MERPQNVVPRKVSSPSGSPGLLRAVSETAASSSQRKSLALHAGTSTMVVPLLTPVHFCLLSPGGCYYLGPKFALGVHRTLGASLPHPAPQILRRQRAPKVLSWKKKFVLFSPINVAWGRLDLQILPIPQHSPNSRGASISCQCPNQRTRDFSLCITTEVGPCEGLLENKKLQA